MGIGHRVSARSRQRAAGSRILVQGTGRSKEQEKYDALYPEPCTLRPNYWLGDSLISESELLTSASW